MLPQLTTLLSNEVLARVERMRIHSARQFTSRMRGEHLSGKGGHSIEFSDFRDYVEGDDIKYVDWNIFSRLQRPYVKLFHHEEEQHVVVLIDGSNSMLFEDKLRRANQLAAAFGVMGLFNVERVSAYAMVETDGPLPALRPCTGRGSMSKLFGFLESIEGGGSLPLEQGVEQALREHRGRGVVVVLSDFLTYGDLARPLTRLRSAGLEVLAVQILGPTELDPELDGDLRFVDSEGAGTLDVSAAGDVVGLYQEYRQRYQRHLENLCRQRGGRCLTVSSQESIESLLFDRLRRTRWVR